MKIAAVNVDMEAFGAQFANMDDEDQALFFMGLAGELRCWKSTYQAQMQFHSVARKLKKETKELLADMVGVIWYKEEG
jgi:hypothetical protein